MLVEPPDLPAPEGGSTQTYSQDRRGSHSARSHALSAQPTCFLIADISGYTGYLADVELDHAQDILADLVGAVVTALRPNFRLAKLEGDAAFTFMTAERDRRLDASRHDRALLLRVPPAPP